MPKKRKGRPQKIRVKTSKAHRRPATWVPGHWRYPTKPFRIKTHRRNTRRTKKEIAKKGTRKQERRKKMHRSKRKIPKTTQTRL